MTTPPSSLIDWLTHASERIRRLDGVVTVTIERGPTAVRIEHQHGVVVVQPRPADGRKAWLSANGTAFNVECEPEPLPNQLLAVLRQVRTVFAATPRLAHSPPHGSGTRVGDALRLRLRRAAYHTLRLLDADPRILPPIERDDGTTTTAWRALVLQDFYPHVGALGDPVAESDVVTGWRSTVRRIREGRAPAQVGLYVHFPFCAVQCRFCYCAMTDNLAQGAIGRYLERLTDDFRRYGAAPAGCAIPTPFIGGGRFFWSLGMRRGTQSGFRYH